MDDVSLSLQVVIRTVECVSVACAHLELLYRRHVVAEHAIFQQGDGVTLTAHFLDLLTSAVATGSCITVRRNTGRKNFFFSKHI